MSSISHARRRSKERLGIKLTNAIHSKIISDIQRGRATFLKRRSLSRTMWLVNITDKKQAIVVYSTKHKKLITLWFPGKN